MKAQRELGQLNLPVAQFQRHLDHVARRERRHHRPALNTNGFVEFAQPQGNAVRDRKLDALGSQDNRRCLHVTGRCACLDLQPIFDNFLETLVHQGVRTGKVTPALVR